MAIRPGGRSWRRSLRDVHQGPPPISSVHGSSPRRRTARPRVARVALRVLFVVAVTFALMLLGGTAGDALLARDAGPVVGPAPGADEVGRVDVRGRTGAGGRDLDDEALDGLLHWLSRAAPGPAVEAVWDRLARCESSGAWDVATGNGYFGGLQFDEPTWRAFGGGEYAPRADGATREQQIAVAIRVRDHRGGYGSWPACAGKLGLPR